MNRLACVNLPAFPLQLLLRRHGDWAAYPAAVVGEDKPQGMILWVNEKARQARVLPGLRYAAGSSLAPDLRAGVVPSAEIEKEIAALMDRFLRFTPEVEPSHEEPGVFWLSGMGLNLLYPSLREWAAAIYVDIKSQGFNAKVVAGFTRFGTYAVARVGEGAVVFENLFRERAAAREVPLSHLGLDPELRDALFKLGIKTVGEFLSLPAGGLYERFGPKSYRLHRMASGNLWAPLHPCAPKEAVRQRLLLDDPETDAARLLFLIKRLLHPLLAALATRSEAITELWLRFLIDRSGWCEERIRPAAPTLDPAQLLDLVRLRLERTEFFAGVNPVPQNASHVSAGMNVLNLSEGQRRKATDVSPWYGVKEIELTAKGSPATAEQLRLFAERPARDLDAANRALARLRAEFGDEAVLRAKLTYGHLPEARFAWELLESVNSPRPDHNPHVSSQRGNILAAVGLNDLNVLNRSNCSNRLSSPLSTDQGPEREAPRVLVRRILAKPVPLPARPRTHDDGWLLLGPKYGAIEKLSGPYLISGGWWVREIHREYYFAETHRGDILWVYYDRPRRRWFLQGWIE